MDEKKTDLNLSMTKTATSDGIFHFVEKDVWIREGNFVIITNPAYQGSFAVQPIPFSVNSSFSFQDFNLKDIFFKNQNAGSNTTIVFSGILMTRARKIEFGVPVE
jgi:hypothetical protein